MKLLYKLLTIPGAAYFASMFTVALMGTFMERSNFMELTGGTALYIWYVWLGVLAMIIIAQHFLKKKRNE